MKAVARIALIAALAGTMVVPTARAGTGSHGPLDPWMLNLYARLRRDFGLTSILVSHDLAVVAHLCERIAIMQLGRVVEFLGVDDLRRGAVRQDYSRELLAASRGFVPSIG